MQNIIKTKEEFKEAILNNVIERKLKCVYNSEDCIEKDCKKCIYYKGEKNV